MKSTWKRALATLLTIAMMATLLVVPAAAADKYTYNFSTDTTSDFFTITATDGDYRTFKTPGTFDSVTYTKGLTLTQDSTGKPTNALVEFSGAGTLKVLLAQKKDACTLATGKKVHIDGVDSANRYTSDATAWVTAELGQGNHALWARDQVIVLAMEFTPVSTGSAFVTGVELKGTPDGGSTATNTPSVTVKKAARTIAMTADVTGGESGTVKSWTVTDADGNDATAKGVTITEGADGKSATVNVAATATRGKYTITAVSTDPGDGEDLADGVTGTATLSVNRAVLEGLSFTTADQSLKVGDEPVQMDTKTQWAAASTADCIVDPEDDADAVNFSSSDTSVVTVTNGNIPGDGIGTLTVVGVGSAVITATSVRTGPDGQPKTATMNVTVDKGDKTLKLSKPNNTKMVATGGDFLFELEGLPDDETAAPHTFVTVTPSEGVSVSAPTADDKPYSDESQNKDGWNVKVHLPANETDREVQYTVSAAYDGTSANWNVTGTPSQSVCVLGADAKTIAINAQTNAGGDVTITSGQDLVLKVDAVVKDATNADTSDAIDFTWKHGDDELTADGSTIIITTGTCTLAGHVGHTECTLTIKGAMAANAGEYTCEAAAQEDASNNTSASFTVKVNKKAGVVPTADVDAATRKLTGVQAGWQYSLDGVGDSAHWQTIDGTEVTIPETIDGVTMSAVNGIDIKDPGDADTLPATQHIVLTRAETPDLEPGDGVLIVTNHAEGQTYEIKGGSYADFTAVTATENTDKTEATISGLTNGTEYEVRVPYQGHVLGSLETAKATPTEPAGDPAELLTAIRAAKNQVIGIWYSADGTDVVEGAKWVSTADGAAYNAAIAKATAVANSETATTAQINAAKDELAQAVNTFKALEKKVGTKKADAFVLNMNEQTKQTLASKDNPATMVEGLGTQGFFTLVGNKAGSTAAAVEDGDALFDNGFFGYQRWNAQGKVEGRNSNSWYCKAIKFTTTVPNATVKVWTRNGGTSIRHLGVMGQATVTSTTDVAPGACVVDTLTLAAAGTYYLGASDNTLHIYRVEVVQPGVDPHPEVVDTSDLDAAIAQAKALDTTLATSADGEDIAQGTQWVTEKMKSDLATALSDAESVCANADATQDEVDAAAEALTAAIAAYQPADGKKLASDVSGLATAVAAAKAKMTGVETSDDGGADIAKDKTWVTAAVKAALEQAITDAETVIAKGENATETEITAAAQALKTASDAFVPAAGTKEPAVTKYTVTVTGGTTDKAEAAEGESVTVTANAPDTGKVFDKWTSSDLTLSAADEVKATVTFSMPAKNVALTATYKDDQGGDKPDGPDKTALNSAITAAEAAIADVEVSTDGADVSKSKQWVTQEAKDAYAAAIAAAKTVAGKADATEENVTQAVADLAEATTAFEAAKADGTKTSSGSRPAIGSGTTPSGDTTATNPDGAKVTVSTDKDGATTAAVTVPSGVDKTTVTIPVAQPSNTLVPVIVNADGTEEIVRMSAVTEDGVALTLDKSATVKLVNNAKEFVDVPGHWAEKSVDFTTARELFNGTDATHFTPDGAMTRAMMATVLFRLSGEDQAEAAANFTDVADTWYTDAVAWAAETGVVNGYGNGTFVPEKSITREELAVMVYRYAKSLGLGYAAGQEIPDLTYADADQVSEWAYEAISWLSVNGVLNGKPGNVVDAAGLASRAEVSTVLERFVKLAK